MMNWMTKTFFTVCIVEVIGSILVAICALSKGWDNFLLVFANGMFLTFGTFYLGMVIGSINDIVNSIKSHKSITVTVLILILSSFAPVFVFGYFLHTLFDIRLLYALVYPMTAWFVTLASYLIYCVWKSY